MRVERAVFAVAVALAVVGGVGAAGPDEFARSFAKTLDAGAVGFFLTATAAVWLSVLAVRRVRRLRSRSPVRH